MGNKIKPFLTICENRCWCEFCGESIEKKEKFLLIYKSAQKGQTRTNICMLCLNDINKEIKKKDILPLIKLRIISKLK